MKIHCSCLWLEGTVVEMGSTQQHLHSSTNTPFTNPLVVPSFLTDSVKRNSSDHAPSLPLLPAASEGETSGVPLSLSSSIIIWLLLLLLAHPFGKGGMTFGGRQSAHAVSAPFSGMTLR